MPPSFLGIAMINFTTLIASNKGVAHYLLPRRRAA
jgi:hypothetical protein